METHIVQQTIHQLHHNISKQVLFQSSWKWLGPLNDENNLQIDEKYKNWEIDKKNIKILKMCNIINLKTVWNKLASLDNIIYSILSYKLMGL